MRLCCPSVVPFSPVVGGVIEEENAEEFESQYNEQELPEGFEDESNLFPFDHIYPSFQTQPIEV